MNDPIDDLIAESRDRVAASDREAARLASSRDELVGLLRTLYGRFVEALVAAGRADQRATITTLVPDQQQYKTGPFWRRTTGFVPVKRLVDLEQGWVIAGGPRVDFRTYKRAIDTDGGGTSNWYDSFLVLAESDRLVIGVEGNPGGYPGHAAREFTDPQAVYAGPLRLRSLHDTPIDFVRVDPYLPRTAEHPDPLLFALQAKIDKTTDLLDARLKHLGLGWARASV